MPIPHLSPEEIDPAVRARGRPVAEWLLAHDHYVRAHAPRPDADDATAGGSIANRT